MDKKEKQLSSKEIYKGRILDVYVDDVELPNGHRSKREYIKHCKASAILAFDIDGKIILENQFRYPYDELITEVPAGKCDENEDPKETALRELEEETGYHATNIEPLGQMYPSVAYTDEIIYLFMATGLVKTNQHLDEDEALDFFKVSLSKMIEMVRDGSIKDAKTICCLNNYLLKYKKFK
ncbi:MAG: NUDIX hydrolase [Bacilli bacterium]